MLRDYLTKRKFEPDPLGMINFELTERLNSALINVMCCCGRICFKEGKRENPDHSIIEKYDLLATEAVNVRNGHRTFDTYDRMRKLIKKYSLKLRRAERFEEEKYDDYAGNKVGEVTE